MATPIAGRQGRLYADNSVDGTGAAVPMLNLNSWSLNRTTDKIEVTSFGDTSKAYVVSLPDAQGDLAGFWDTDGGQYKLSAAIDGGRKFYLYPTTATTTKYWFGKAHFDISVNSTVSGAWAIAASLLDNGITA